MNRWIFFSMLLSLVTVAAGQSRAGKDFALFFANDDYRTHPGFSSLRNPIKDARAVAGELRDMYSFEVEIHENYTRDQIYSVLERWQKRSFSSDGQLLIFFSGHGDFWEFTKKGYFVPKTNVEDYSAYIELTDLGNIVTQIPCRHILLAVDACYSGAIDQEIAFKGRDFGRPRETVSSERDNLIYRQLRNQSRLLITSGGKQRTPDGREHSPFAGAILDGLRAAYTYGDGLLTFTDLLGKLERVSPTPHQGALPEHEQGGFVFVAKGGSKPPDNMVFIQGGSFEMGDVFGDGQEDEKPAHTVTVTDFQISRHEVTVAEFSRFIEATGYRTDADKDDGSYVYENDKWTKKAGINWRYGATGNRRPAGEYNHPVIHVSWNDAVAYCNWLSEQHGYRKVYTVSGDKTTADWNADGYRLPTEAEWEFAGRQRGAKVRFGNGKNIADPTEINFDGNASYKQSYSKEGVYRENTTEVGSFSGNSLGLHDMSGNVWEWCWDWYASDYYEKSKNSRDPRGPDAGSSRVVRGGSWVDLPADVRVADRSDFTPGYRGSDIGFRLARAVR